MFLQTVATVATSCMRILYCTTVLLLLIGGCRFSNAPADYVARVGSYYLTATDVEQALAAVPQLRDTTAARQQFIQDWVTQTLLYREAQQRSLREQANVQKRLREAERSTLINALVEKLKADVSRPSEVRIRTYYEQHKDQLRLQEPFLKLRYIESLQPDSLRRLRAELLEAPTKQEQDSLWERATTKYAANRSTYSRLEETHYPLPELTRKTRLEQSHLQPLQIGDVSPVIEDKTVYALGQVVDRKDKGSVPSLAWVRDHIIQQLLIQEKKLIYSQEVQRLRTRARAHEILEVRE